MSYDDKDRFVRLAKQGKGREYDGPTRSTTRYYGYAHWDVIRLAIDHDDMEALDHFVRNGTFMREPDITNHTPFMHALRGKAEGNEVCAKAVDVILGAGYDMNALDKYYGDDPTDNELSIALDKCLRVANMLRDLGATLPPGYDESDSEFEKG